METFPIRLAIIAALSVLIIPDVFLWNLCNGV
jgi:hypothetical protein